jgi:peptidyl-Asp metalloendopeptidase
VWRELGGSSLTEVWYLNNGQYTSGAVMTYNNGNGSSPNSDWRIDGIADANSDGRPDLLWRNYVNSSTVFWYGTSGFNFTGGTLLVPSVAVPNTYSLDGIGDFNGDGVQDIFWRNPANQLIYWQMNAGYQSINANGSTVISASAGAIVEQVGDVNGDNRTDVVWKMPDGKHVAWVLGPDSNGKPTILPLSTYLPGNNSSINNNFVNNGNFHSEFGSGMVDVTAALHY